MFRNCLIMVLAVVLTACGGMENKKRVEVLDEAVNHYVQALRWGRMNDAVAFHLEKDKQKPEIDLKPMDTIRVTGYVINERTLSEDLTGAEIKGELNYYNSAYGTLKKMSLTQNWWFDAETKRWYLESDFPKFDGK